MPALQFLSTPSGWRATRDQGSNPRDSEFLSTPSGWRATARRCPGTASSAHFYPRPPGGGRQIFIKRTELNKYFYPRPPGGGRPRAEAGLVGCVLISIHALRVEGDGLIVPKRPVKLNFYPRPPGGGRPQKVFVDKSGINFYPRPPGGGRRAPARKRFARKRISIHALRVEGDLLLLGQARGELISIHALRVEGDLCKSVIEIPISISIHALRVEGY